MTKIYCIITTSLIKENMEAREEQYIRGINSLIKICKNTDIKIIIVENNNLTSSFLDNFDVEVNYTNTNSMPTTNYGIKEAYDILNCIEKYNINDDDYIIKMTGRYYLSDDCPFFNEIENLYKNTYEVIIKYGWWGNNMRIKHANCFTGLICMKAKYIKQINLNIEPEICIEIEWGRATLNIEDTKICMLNKLGLNTSPKCYGNNKFFEV